MGFDIALEARLSAYVLGPRSIALLAWLSIPPAERPSFVSFVLVKWMGRSVNALIQKGYDRSLASNALFADDPSLVGMAPSRYREWLSPV